MKLDTFTAFIVEWKAVNGAESASVIREGLMLTYENTTGRITWLLFRKKSVARRPTAFNLLP